MKTTCKECNFWNRNKHIDMDMGKCDNPDVETKVYDSGMETEGVEFNENFGCIFAEENVEQFKNPSEEKLCGQCNKLTYVLAEMPEEGVCAFSKFAKHTKSICDSPTQFKLKK